MPRRLLVRGPLALLLVTSLASVACPQEAADRPAAAKRTYRKEYAEFLAKPPPVREHLRRMDRALADEDSETQIRLMRVLQRYSDWLDGLTPEQRQSVEGAATTEERLARIAAVREEQWESTLAKVDRLRLQEAKKKSEADYKKALAEVKLANQTRHLEWLTAQAEMSSQMDLLRGMVNRLTNQLRQKLDSEAERAKFDQELKGLSFRDQMEILLPKAEAKGVRVPPGLKNLRLQPEPPLMVERSKLIEFLHKPENEALAKEFWRKLAEPAERHKALADIERKYWEANPSERKNREDHDRRIKRARDKP